MEKEPSSYATSKISKNEAYLIVLESASAVNLGR